MRWMTLAHLHLDRVATAWLIRRCVDPGATFAYLPWGTEPPAETDDTRLFGIPGVALGSHDESGTCFRKVIRAFHLDDPAIELVEQAVDSGVRHALGLPPAERRGDVATVGVALDLIGIGFGVTSDDPDHLERATPVYDALYRWCQSTLLPDDVRARIPRLPGDRAAFLRDALGT